MSSTAFVTTFAPLAKTSFTSGTTTLTKRPSVALATPRMALKTEQKPKTSTTFSRLEENRLAKRDSEYRGPQGFTPYAEKVNGRMAMLGFFIGLVTEIVSGVPINEQMLIMFSPLTHSLEALFKVLGA